MLPPLEKLLADEPEWQALCHQLQAASHLSAVVLVAWQMAHWLAHGIVEQHLHHRATVPTHWPSCPSCGHRLESKGFVRRQILTLVGQVEWKRRVGRCPKGCKGSHVAPMDKELGLVPYQHISTELLRLGCLLSIFLPFELSAQLLGHLTGVSLSAQTLWQGVQQIGQRAMAELEQQLERLADGCEPAADALSEAISQLPLVLGADGVMVPFRREPHSPKGKIVWREVKVGVLTRIGKHVTRKGKSLTRLYHRRLVAVLGNLEALQVRMKLEASKHKITQAPQVVWISDGAKGFWRVFEESFADCALGILDFYHGVQQLWGAAEAYGNGTPGRTPQMWFERMRRQLKGGFGHRIIDELDWLSKQSSTDAEAQPILRRVSQYLARHREHIKYRHFKKQGLPIGSGMVESACKWLIQQRFKGVGMRWSEPGFNHLLHLRLAWVNQRFETLFDDGEMELKFYSPKP